MQDAHLLETQQSLRPIRPQHQQRQRQNQQFEGGENFVFLCRSQDWMAVLPRATEKPAGSIFIFIFNANELELMATYIIREMVVISVSWKEFQKIDRGVWTVHPQSLHIQRSTVSSQARNASHALGSRIAKHLCALEKSLSSGPHTSHPLLLSHLPRTTSSFTLPSTIYSKNTQYIINLSKNIHSLSVKTQQCGGIPRKTFSTFKAHRT